MVRCASILYRVPTIKFRKGNIGSAPAAGHPIPSSSASGAAAGSHPQAPQAAQMSSSISDIDLPPRYRRAPISEEEIAHINGGGIV